MDFIQCMMQEVYVIHFPLFFVEEHNPNMLYP